MRVTIMALSIAVAASLATRDPALDPVLDPAPAPAASETMQSVIDSLLTRSQERRAAHNRLLAQQDADEAAPDEAIGQAGAENSPAATSTALPDPVPESFAVAQSVPAAPAAAPTAAELQAAEAKVARVTDELKRLRSSMAPNCADAQSTELATQPAPSPVPEPCPDWIGSVREAMRRLDQCQAELNDLNRQLDEREQLLTRLRAAPPVDASTAAHVLNAPTATPCPTVNETVVTVERPHSAPSPTPPPPTLPRRIIRPLRSPNHDPPISSPPTLNPLATQVERVVYKNGSPPQATTTPAAMPEAAMSDARPAADPAAGRARAAGNAVAALSLSAQEAGAAGAVISRKEWLVERRAAAAAAPAAAAAAAAAAGAVSSQHQPVLRTSPGGSSSAVLVAAVPPSPSQHRWKQIAASRPAARADALVAALRPEDWAALAAAGGGAEAAAGGTPGTPRACAYAGVLPGLEAHGLPALRVADGAAGFRNAGDCAPRTMTLWPSALTVAATWDPQAAASWGGALGAEARRKGAGVLLAPDLRLAAAPRDARNAERLSGEDPTLGAALGGAAVRGIQSQGIVAAATADLGPASAAAAGRTRTPLSPRARREMAYPPLAAAVAAGLGGLACGAAPGRGVPVENTTTDGGCADAQAVQELRDAIGFQGFVLSRGAQGAADGADLQLPGSEGGAAALRAPEAATAEVAEAAGAEARWGEAARRVLRPMFTLGQLDHAPLPREAAGANATSGEHADLARQIAGAGAVLLQNTGELLPLSAAALQSIAVIGDAAHLTAALAAAGADASRVTPPRLVSALDGVKAHLADVGSAAAVTYTPTGTDGGRAAAAAATSAQLALICVAAPVAEVEGLAEGTERPGLGLAPRDLQLLQSVLAVQPNAVVVVTAPGGVLLPFAPGAAALLLAFWPGQEWGAALADLLFGATSPSEP